MESAAPINLSPEAATCPACGEPNRCGAVAAGRHDVACWCATVVIPASATRNRDPMRCLCVRCAAGDDAVR